MTYRDEIRPWAIYKLMPNGQNICITRLRKRTDADAYASLLRQGGGVYQVVFDQPTALESSLNSPLTDEERAMLQL